MVSQGDMFPAQVQYAAAGGALGGQGSKNSGNRQVQVNRNTVKTEAQVRLTVMYG